MTTSAKKTSISSNGNISSPKNPNSKPNKIKWVMIFIVFVIIGVLIWILTKPKKKIDSGGSGSGCASPSDCSEGEICKDGVCENSQGNTCSSDSDCPGNQICSPDTKKCVCSAGYGTS
jgi:hypothetical protein